MRAPAITDRMVKVMAYMTDMYFGYDYWAARQFCAPSDGKFAILVICDTEAERDSLIGRIDKIATN